MKRQLMLWFMGVLTFGLPCWTPSCSSQEVVAECVRYSARAETKLYVFSFFSKFGEYSTLFKPVIGKVEQRFGGEVRIFRVNIDNPGNEEFVERVGVAVVPTVIVVDQEGNRLATMVGMNEATRLDITLEALLTRYRDPVAMERRNQLPPASTSLLRALEPKLDRS